MHRASIQNVDDFCPGFEQSSAERGKEMLQQVQVQKEKKKKERERETRGSVGRQTEACSRLLSAGIDHS